MPLDSTPILSVLDRITDANGDPVSGGYIEFYDAGTSTPRTVYSDSTLSTSLGTIVYGDTGGFPVSTQGGTTKVAIYTGTGAYKVIVKNASDVTLLTLDNLPGALDTSSFAPTTASPDTPVLSKTSTYSITVNDAGKLINANPTGGTFAITLPSAVTVGDGFRVGIRHAGTANNVDLLTVSSQTIAHAGPATQAIALNGRGETFWLVSDGSGWTVDTYVPPIMRGNMPSLISITDRLSSPPTSPTAGARYIVGSSPTGAWSTLSFSQHDIAEADGNGSWIKYTPTDGWLAYVLDENLLTQYRDTTWTDLSNITAPTSSALEVAEIFYDGTGTNTLTQSAWTTVPLATSAKNSITGASLASNKLTLPAGDYLVYAMVSMLIPQSSGASTGRCRIYDVTNSAEKITSNNHTTNNVASQNSGLVPTLFGYLSVAAATEYRLEAWTSTASVNLGSADTSSSAEKYANLVVIDLASMQGPTGAQGTQGVDGLDAAYPYQWSTSTSGDPGSGKVAGNNATIASITQIAISETDSAGGSMAAVIATWDDSTSSVRGRIKISKEGATQNFHAFTITGAGTDQGAYWTFPVTYVSTSGTISNADNCAVLVIEKGDKGDTGATGSAGVYSFDYTFDTGTSAADPGSGKVRANNATLSSATALYINETDRLAVSQAAAIAQWDDSTTTIKGYLTLVDLTTPANRVRFSVGGSNTDNGSYDTINVTYVSGVTSLTAVNVAILFERVGDKGADGAGSGDFVGPSSATDNAVVRFDTTTGKLGQNSVVTISDAGAIAGTTSITPAANDGGALGDATHSYSDLFLASGAVANFNNGNITVTHAANQLNFAGASNPTFSFVDGNNYFRIATGNPGWVVDNTDEMVYDRTNNIWEPTIGGAIVAKIGAASLSPGTSDGQALGTTSLMWSDLFLASGAVTNYNNGDVTVTHSAGRLTFAGAKTVTSTSATALVVGANGATNPVLKVDASTASVATGISVTGAAAASRAAVAVLSSGVDEGLSLDAKGAGTIRLGATSTGAVEFSRNAVPTASDGAALGTTSLMWSDVFFASGAVINFNNGDVTLTHSANLLAFAGAASGYTFDALISPSTNDAAALGSATVSWADLFLASGGVINWNNGNVTLTHSAATLTLAGATSLAMGASIAVALGTIELGHATDTTLSRSAAGELAVEGTIVKKVGKETVWIPANAMTARTTNGAAAGSVESATNKIMQSTLDFDQSTAEYAQFGIRLPKSWNGSTITAAFTWTANSTSTNNVIWGIQAVAIGNDETIDTAFGTAQTVTDANTATAYQAHITGETSAVTIGSSPAVGDWVIFQVYRDAANGSDTLAVDALLLGVSLYFTTSASTDA